MKNYYRLFLEGLRTLITFKNFPIFFKYYLGYAKKQNTIEAVLWNGVIYKINGENPMVGRLLIQDLWLNNVYNLTKNDFLKTNIVIDIGAHIGTFSVFAASKIKNAIVYSFEPEPGNFNLLLENIRLNKLEKRIQAFQVAVSSYAGEQKLFLSKMVSTRHSLFENRFLQTSSKKFIQVRSTTIEEIFKVNAIKTCDILKIDCEGSEFDILFGTPPSIFKKIKKIVIEYHDDVTNYTHIDLIKFFRRQGFIIGCKENSSDARLGFIYAINRKYS